MTDREALIKLIKELQKKFNKNWFNGLLKDLEE